MMPDLIDNDSVALEANPYRAPNHTSGEHALTELPIYFQGSMNPEEGRQAGFLVKGKSPAKPVTISQVAGIGLSVLAVTGYFVWESIVYDELDQLLNLGLGIVGVAAVLLGSWWGQRHQLGSLTKAKEQQRGVFTPIAGRLDETGVEFLIEDFPIRYEWNDFVCSRAAENVLLLYVDYPGEMNFLAESMFVSQEAWMTARRIAVSTVKPHSKLRLPGAWKSSRRMTQIAAGVRALQTQEWSDASTHFATVLATDPTNFQALRGQIVALAAMGDTDSAMAAVEQLTRHSAIDPASRRVRSALLLNAERYEEALDDLNCLMERSPSDSNLLRDRGLALLKTGQLEDAVRDTSAAIELNPDDFVALNNRGAILMQMGLNKDAVADLEKAIRLSPEFERPRELLAQASL